MNHFIEKIKKIFQSDGMHRSLRPVLSGMFFLLILAVFFRSASFLYQEIGRAVEKPASSSASSLSINSDLFYTVAPRLGITIK
jgi:hypothetical protein